MTATKVKSFLFRVLCGFLFGVSVIAPGVSGSVIAVIMGIYGDLITIVSNPFKNFKKNFFYLLPLGIGAIVAVALFVNILDWMFTNYRVPSFLLFVGLIGGSVPSVLKEAKTGGPFKKKYIFAIVLAFAFALTIGILKITNESLTSDIPQSILFPISGALAGISSMIPGMSISMILMVLGVYEPMMSATKNLEVWTMAPVGICFVVGMVLFSKLTKYVFDKYHSLGYYMVTGFMSGSLLTIIISEVRLPKDALGYILSALAIIIGVAVATLFNKLGEKFNVSNNE